MLPSISYTCKWLSPPIRKKSVNKISTNLNINVVVVLLRPECHHQAPRIIKKHHRRTAPQTPSNVLSHRTDARPKPTGAGLDSHRSTAGCWVWALSMNSSLREFTFRGVTGKTIFFAAPHRTTGTAVVAKPLKMPRRTGGKPFSWEFFGPSLMVPHFRYVLQ